MNKLKGLLKRITPVPVWQTGRSTWNALLNATLWPSATFHPWRRASIRRLGELKDVHRGQRCFIIGNGPSLNRTDMNLLKDEFTIGTNRIYLGFSRMGFETSYYLAINSLVIEQCAADIRALRMPRFICWRSRKAIGSAPDLNFLHTTYTGPAFAHDARGRLWEGATVTYVALQLAFHLGFEQVILIGVDHNYSTQGVPNTTVVSQGDDPDHFDASYFGKGFRWQLPDLDTSERAYQMARLTYQQAGRKVVDATVGGNLTVFPKVDYTTLF
jgi:hypothetical protein